MDVDKKEEVNVEFSLENDRELIHGTLKLDEYDLPDDLPEPATPTKRHQQQLREIDIRQFELLARMGCTWSELEEFYGVHASTLRKYLTHNYRKGRADLKITLRRAQLNEAIKRGNATLLIFLGKNILGQSDAGEVSKEEQAEITFVTKMFRKDVLPQLEQAEAELNKDDHPDITEVSVH